MMIYLGEQINPDKQSVSNSNGELAGARYPSSSLDLLGSLTAKVVYYREFPADLDPGATHDASGNRIIVIE